MRRSVLEDIARDDRVPHRGRYQPRFLLRWRQQRHYKFMNRISAGFSGTDAAPTAMASSFTPADGVTSGIVIDTRTAGMTGSMATANIYFGTAGVSATTQSTIVQLAQAF